MDKERINVFIATLPRSGSTLLGMILGSHTQIYHSGESSYWGKIDARKAQCSCGRTGCNFLVSVQERIEKNREAKSIYNACCIVDKMDEPKKVYHPMSLPSDDFTGEISLQTLNAEINSAVSGLEMLNNTYRNITHKTIIVDNTKNIRIAEYLTGRNWKILLLLRDPRGLAYSNKKAGIRKNVARSVYAKIPVYIDFAKRALTLMNKKNVLLVRYEDICNEPVESITKVCSFLGINFEKQMLRFKKRRMHMIMGNRMRLNGNETIVEDLGWMSGLSDYEKKLICSNSGLTRLFDSLGYKLSCDKGG